MKSIKSMIVKVLVGFINVSMEWNSYCDNACQYSDVYNWIDD